MRRVYLAAALAVGALFTAGSVPADAGTAESCLWRGGGRPKCLASKALCQAGEKRVEIRKRLGFCPRILCCKKRPDAKI